MYRLLKLIPEQGNYGLVYKIVFAQDSLQAFINALCPDAYSSITKVNLEKLDDLLLKPVGGYGSIEEIMRFLCEIGAVYIEMARELLVPQHDYISRDCTSYAHSHLLRRGETFVLYWPENTTWDDNAISTVQSNRAIMRYRTTNLSCYAING